MKLATSSVSLLLLAACASTGPESQIGTQDKADQQIKMTRTSDCVFHSTISGFDALDDRYVVLYSLGRRKAYLAEISAGCFDVEEPVPLAAVDGDGNGQICGFGRDSVAYRRIGMVENCRILGLEELSDERRARARPRSPARRSPKKEDKPRTMKRKASRSTAGLKRRPAAPMCGEAPQSIGAHDEESPAVPAHQFRDPARRERHAAPARRRALAQRERHQLQFAADFRRRARIRRRLRVPRHLQVDGEAHDGRAGDREPRNEHETWLVETVRRLAAQAGIGMPEVGYFDSPAPNAFATGARRDKSLVAVSTGLLQRMNRSEVEAVLGHEVSHVANGDMVTLTLIQGVVNTFVFVASRLIGNIVDKVVFRNERGHGPAFWITTIVAELVLAFLATMIVMWFSRQREFRADGGGARLAGRQNMISALQALGRGDGAPLPDKMAAFGISGRKGEGFAAFS